MNTVSAAEGDEREDKPLDPEVEAVRRKLARLLMVSIGIMIIGLMAVLMAIVYKMSRSDGAAPPPAMAATTGTLKPAAELVLRLPAGARIVSHSLSGRYLTVQVELAGGGSEIVIFDVETNATVATIAVSQ